MKQTFGIGLILLACAAVAVAAAAQTLPVQVPATDPNVRFIGRWDMSAPAAPRASWTYSFVTARFKGTAISAKMKGGGFAQVAIDGQPTKVIAFKNGQDVYELAAGLADKEHTVEVTRRDEAPWVEPITFQGFLLEAGGKPLPLPPRSNRRLLIIGDSISCGYGNESPNRNEHYVREKQNGYQTYGAMAARALGAEVEIVAWSGRKLWPDNTMVEVWDRIYPDKPEPKADFKGWVPDVVLVNLGTNDFGPMKNTPENEKGWTDAYKAFIKTIRGHWPNCYVIVAAGSMGIKPEWDKWAKEVVADQKAAGDKKICYLPFENQKEEDGIGGDWHPSVKTHQKMADRLVKELQAAVGWTPVATMSATRTESAP
jgi:lysophospholipase L1-like esterase